MADTEREADLRKEYIDTAVKAVVKLEEIEVFVAAIDVEIAKFE